MSAAVERAAVTRAVPAPGHWYVSTALDSWFTERPDVFARDVQIDDIMYRRLDPEYYAWLRSRMILAKAAASAGQIRLAAFEDLRQRFGPIHQWAIEVFGEPVLIAAVRSLEGREYTPPVAEKEQPRTAVPASTDRNVVSVTAESVALVDVIRDRARELGWSNEALYRTRGSLRFPVGSDYGLVCYLKPDDRIGEVVRESIEIVGANNVRRRFYNPDVDQPWIAPGRHNEKVTPGVYKSAALCVYLH